MLENSRTTFLYYFSQATEFTESTETDKKLHLGIACAVLMWAHPKRGGDFFGTSTVRRRTWSQRENSFQGSRKAKTGCGQRTQGRGGEPAASPGQCCPEQVDVTGGAERREGKACVVYREMRTAQEIRKREWCQEPGKERHEDRMAEERFLTLGVKKRF